MITDAILYFVGFIAASVAFVLIKLSLLLTAVPYMDEAFGWLFGAISYFGGVFPVADIFAAITFLIVFFEFLYSLKLLFWVMQAFPFIGRLRYPYGSEFRVDESQGVSQVRQTYLPASRQRALPAPDRSRWFSKELFKRSSRMRVR